MEWPEPLQRVATSLLGNEAIIEGRKPLALDAPLEDSPALAWQIGQPRLNAGTRSKVSGSSEQPGRLAPLTGEGMGIVLIDRGPNPDEFRADMRTSGET